MKMLDGPTLSGPRSRQVTVVTRATRGQIVDLGEVD